MLEVLLDSFQHYYGLDWLALICGFSGMYLLTKKHKGGFLLSALGCFAGLAVATISFQFGFVVSNILMVGVMLKGYMDWT